MNDAAKHTPGAWEQEEDSFYISGKDKYPLIAKVEVATSNDGSGPEYDEAEANARLIAAAPDLLEALEAYILAMDLAAGAKGSGADTRPGRKKARELAVEAIKNARRKGHSAIRKVEWGKP